MRILILANHGMGLYKFRKELIKKLIDENYKVYVSFPKDDYTKKLENLGCIFIETNVNRRGVNPISDLKLLLNYVKIIKQVKPDVVLTYTIKPNVYGSLACRLLNIPYINNITGLGSGFNNGVLLKSIISFLYKLSLRKSLCVFFQNESDMKSLVQRNIVKSNYHLIPGSGVNLTEFQYKEYPKEEPITFLFIGRIMKEKGIDQYLEAAKFIKKKYTNTQFNLIGFVEKTQQQYEGIIKKYNDYGYVNYLGYQPDVKPYIEKSHCLIQASHSGEGLSNVLLEAGAMGRALIASNIPGCRETVDEGRNGFLFEAKNEHDLIEKIEKFINLPYETKEKFGKNSRLKVEKEFDRKFVVNSYFRKIKEIKKS